MMFTYQGIVPWRRVLPIIGVILFCQILIGLLIKPHTESFLLGILDVMIRMSWEVFCFTMGLFGLTIRMLANGYGQSASRKPHQNKGIYALVRHPLYVGNFLLGLAPVMILGIVSNVVLYIGVFVIYGVYIIVRDQRKRNGNDDSLYRTWLQTTPAFIPRSLHWDKPDAVFQWKNCLRKEHFLFLGLIAAMTLVDNINDGLERGTIEFDYHWLPALTLAVGSSLAVYSIFRLCLFLFCLILFFVGFGKIAKAQHFDSCFGVDMFLAKPTKKLTSLSSQFFPNALVQPQWKTSSHPFAISATPYSTSRVTALPYATSGIVSIPFSGISLRGCAPRYERRLFDKHYYWNHFSTIRQIAESSRKRIFSDMKNFYDRDNLLNFGVVLAGSAVLANSKLDRNFQRWYQENVRTSSTDNFASASKIFGEGQYFIPAAISSALIYRWFQEHSSNRSGNVWGDFVSRTARGYALGAPTLWVGQYALGGDRPSSGSSYWQPFQDINGISGHAFIGATPFITAAQMTENPWAKGAFYALSTFPAWSRVNDDAHYLSQAVLGWYLSYLSVRAVSETEGLKPLPKGLTLFPVGENKSFGVGFLYQY